MKKIVLTIGAACILALCMFGINAFGKYNQNKNLLKSTTGPILVHEKKDFALVELFTSEGCSSCPLADELVNKLAKENRQNVFILSYHVDYWNRLGWKDKFSKASFTKRQQQYAAYFNKDGVYTPQIVINGNIAFVGSDEIKLYNAINNSIGNTYTSPIQLTANTVHNEIVVGYKINNKETTKLHIALVQLYGSSQVANGENEGRFLQHTNIVTDIKTIPYLTNQNEVKFSIPTETQFKTTNYKIIAFLQNTNGVIVAVNESVIQ